MAALQTIWSQADTGKKTGIAVGVAAILIFLVGMTIWLLRSDYQVLFSGMDPRDAAAVVNELERMKVDYRLEESGSRIVVPDDVVHQVRLKLMGSEIPIAGTVGLEIFNDSDFGMTEFAQKINFQRALQGELTRTIMSLNEVKYARVHLVMPESGLFKSKGKEPSASVTLFLKNGQTPNEQMISGIQRLVSSSVPELETDMVTVTDQRGLTLSNPPADVKGIEGISKRLRKQQEFEEYYSGKVTRLLANRFKTEEMAVSVNISLSYDQVNVTRKGVLSSEDEVRSGVLRRRESSYGAGDRKGKDKSNKTTEVEYELGHQIEQTVEAPGRILRISVGVLVPLELNEKQRQEIKNIVAMVIGFDETRGDAIEVYSSSPLEGHIAKTDSFVASESESVTEKVSAKSGEVGNALPEQDMPPSKQSISVKKVLSKVLANPTLFSLIGVLFVLCFIWFVWLVSKVRKDSRNMRDSVMSDSDREKVLNQIREWLASDESSRQPGEARAS